MKRLGLYIILAAFLTPSYGIAQNYKDEKREIIEQRIDFLLELNEGGEVDFTSLFEQLEVFYDQPLNLNFASKSDLDALLILNDIQINNLLFHIEKNGKLVGLEELQSITGFDTETIRLIRPFVKVNSESEKAKLIFKNAIKEGTSDLFIRYTRILEEQKGFTSIPKMELEENENARYLGSQDKLYTRFRFKYANNLSVGITAEKDAGEEFFRGGQANGFDFYSAHFFAQGFGIVKQVALGDFQAQFGQGLTFWSGLAFGRSPSIFTLKRNAPKLTPYTSVQEDLFLRGGGISFAHKNFGLTIFYSSKGVDAAVSGRDTLTNEIIFSSLSEDGFHRTPGELEDKNVIQNSYIGGNLSFEKRNLSIGFTTVRNQIGGKFQPNNALYNTFRKLQNENTNLGLDFSYLYKNMNLFGEISQSMGARYAYTVGALIVLDQRLSLGIQQRHFERDFKPIQSNAIGEGSSNNNEKGTFLGIESKINEDFSFSAYADRFVFEWLRFQTDAPSDGRQLFAQLNYKPSKQLQVYFRYRNRVKGENSKLTEGLDELVNEHQHGYRLHFDYQLSKSLKLRNRIELSHYKLGENRTERGILIYQDVSYKKLSSPFSFSLRYAIFETDSYSSRIYAYDSDVLYAFSIPAYSGRGTRFYMSTKYRIRRGIDLWLRYAQTYYTDRTKIGNGKDEIQGPVKSEVKAQLRIKF